MRPKRYAIVEASRHRISPHLFTMPKKNDNDYGEMRDDERRSRHKMFIPRIQRSVSRRPAHRLRAKLPFSEAPKFPMESFCAPVIDQLHKSTTSITPQSLSTRHSFTSYFIQLRAHASLKWTTTAMTVEMNTAQESTTRPLLESAMRMSFTDMGAH